MWDRKLYARRTAAFRRIAGAMMMNNTILGQLFRADADQLYSDSVSGENWTKIAARIGISTEIAPSPNPNESGNSDI